MKNTPPLLHSLVSIFPFMKNLLIVIVKKKKKFSYAGDFFFTDAILILTIKF